MDKRLPAELRPLAPH